MTVFPKVFPKLRGASRNDTSPFLPDSAGSLEGARQRITLSNQAALIDALAQSRMDSEMHHATRLGGRDLQRPDPGSGGSASSSLVVTDSALAHQPGTILLVEDEGFVREVAYEVLSRAGYRVLKASNATEALQVFRQYAGPVHLLLTDVVLPDRNGCDLALELATLRDGIKAIFVSGYPENSITRKGLRQPGWLYLPKPFSAASLLQKIEEALPNKTPSRRWK